MNLRNKNTGESGELHYYPDKEYHFTVSTKDLTQTGIYKTLAKLNDDWEDVKEPLIKDEKIRKAVRAWYELFDENQLGQFEDGKYIAVGYLEFVLQTLDKSLTYTFELPFIDGMESLKQRWGLGADYYTITELCGEEE